MISRAVEKFVMRNMSGGGKMDRVSSGAGVSGLYVFLFSLLMLLVKAFLVMLSYNYVMPDLLSSYGVDMRSYRPLTFVNALLLVILFNNLFNYF